MSLSPAENNEEPLSEQPGVGAVVPPPLSATQSFAREVFLPKNSSQANQIGPRVTTSKSDARRSVFHDSLDSCIFKNFVVSAACLATNQTQK